MRDYVEQENELTTAIKKDDIDEIKSIISNKSSIKNAFSCDFFNSLFKPKSEIINYCAYCGSVKCFKFLVKHGYDINGDTLDNAISGGNDEIIQSILKIYKPFISYWYLYILIKKFDNNNACDLLHKTCNPKRTNYQYKSNEIKTNFTDYFLLRSVFQSGNIRLFIKLLDEGFDIYSLKRDCISRIITYTAESGFYTLLHLLFEIIFKNNSSQIGQGYLKNINLNCSVFFGNISILKMFESLNIDKIDFIAPLKIIIKRNHFDIVQYALETSFRQKFDIFSHNAIKLIKESIHSTSTDIFDYLTNHFTNKEHLINGFLNQYNDSLLCRACKVGNIKIVKILCEMILNNNPHLNCSRSLRKAFENEQIDICLYLINRKINVTYSLVFSPRLFKKPECLGKIDIHVFKLIFDKIDSKQILDNFLHIFISLGQKNVVEFLISKGAKLNNKALFLAVNKNDAEMVDIILKYDNRPSFINQISEEGTVLNIAVRRNYLEICKSLLSIKGIDPSLYGKDGCTPLVTAFAEFNMSMIDLFFNFYGKEIQFQTLQINIIIRIIIDLISYKKYKNKWSFLSTFVKASPNDLIKKLLEVENINVNYCFNSYTILSIACINNYIDVIEKLVRLDNCNINHYMPNTGISPLMIAIQNKNFKAAKILLQSPRININHQNYEQDTALIFAVRQNSIEMIDLIVKNKKFDPNTSRLNYSFYISNERIAEYLISINGLDVNYCHEKQDANTNNIIREATLISAINYGYVKKVDMIIHQQSFNQSLYQVQKVFEITNLKKSTEIIKKLSQVFKTNINSHSLKQFLSTVFNKEDIIKFINDPNFDHSNSDIDEFCQIYIKSKTPDYSIIEELIEFDKKHFHLINFEDLNSTCISILTNDISLITKEAVDYFVKFGLNIDMPNEKGIYPLQNAINCSNVEIFNALINTKKINITRKIIFFDKSIDKNTNNIFDKSIDKNTSKFFGKSRVKNIGKSINKEKIEIETTYLHIAAGQKNSEILEKILRLNVINVNAIDSRGDTPLIYAVKYSSNPSNIKILFN